MRTSFRGKGGHRGSQLSFKSPLFCGVPEPRIDADNIGAGRIGRGRGNGSNLLQWESVIHGGRNNGSATGRVVVGGVKGEESYFGPKVFSLVGQGAAARFERCRRFRVPAFSARSKVLDGVSWVWSGLVEIAVGPTMDRLVQFGDIAIFERSSSSMKPSASCQTVWPPTSTRSHRTRFDHRLELGVFPRGSVDNRRVNDPHFQTLLAHVSARALYCDSERPNLG
jgi:hypothetical protein